MGRHGEQQSGVAVRRYLSIGFWLMAGVAAAALGLDIEGDVLT